MNSLVWNASIAFSLSLDKGYESVLGANLRATALGAARIHDPVHSSRPHYNPLIT